MLTSSTMPLPPLSVPYSFYSALLSPLHLIFSFFDSWLGLSFSFVILSLPNELFNFHNTSVFIDCFICWRLVDSVWDAATYTLSTPMKPSILIASIYLRKSLANGGHTTKSSPHFSILSCIFPHFLGAYKCFMMFVSRPFKTNHRGAI